MRVPAGAALDVSGPAQVSMYTSFGLRPRSVIAFFHGAYERTSLSAFSYSVKYTAGCAPTLCTYESSLLVFRSTTASYSLFALRSNTFANDLRGNGWPADQFCMKLFVGSRSFT